MNMIGIPEIAYTISFGAKNPFLSNLCKHTGFSRVSSLYLSRDLNNNYLLSANYVLT